MGAARRIKTAEWGEITLDEVDLSTLAEATGLSPDACVDRLRDSKLHDMADAWRRNAPETPEEVLAFYAETDLYVWELLAWNSSESYARYRVLLDRLATLAPPATHPRVLDYGSGVGTAALELARRGHQVTVADVPGMTFEFAKARLRRHGIEFEGLPVLKEVPDLGSGAFDIVLSFDVLEHLTEPRLVTNQLAAALRPRGIAALVAAFDHDEGDHPHHLGDRSRDLSGHRFEQYLQWRRLRPLGGFIYEKSPLVRGLPRQARYLLWRSTGIHVERLER